MDNTTVQFILKLKDEFSGTLKNISGHTEQLNKQVEHTTGLITKLGEAMAGAFAAEKLYEFGKESLNLWNEHEQALGQIKAGLISTKNAAGLTTEELIKMQEELADKSLNTVTQIAKMQSVLLTFPSVTKANFKDASIAIENMATRLNKGDLQGTVIQVGKALQDPVHGIMALRKAGVNFSDSQKLVLQQLVATGQTMKAQQMILRELGTEFAGSAEIATHLGTGPLTMLKKKYEEIQIQIGGLLGQGIDKLIPSFNKLTNNIEKLINILKQVDYSRFISPLIEIWKLVQMIGVELSKLTKQLQGNTDSLHAAQKAFNLLHYTMMVALFPLKMLLSWITIFIEGIQSMVPVVYGFAAAIKEAFIGIGKVAKDIFGGIGSMISGVLNFDISKIFMTTLKNISLSYYRQSNLDKIVKSVEDLNIDDFVGETTRVITNGANNIADTFINSWISSIQDKLEEEKIKITAELEGKFSQEEINEKLNKLPNIGDISKENLLDYQASLKKLIDDAGLETEDQISKFLENYINNVLKKSLSDAAASFPLTLAQFLASIFPLGTEPLVAVNKANEATEQLTDNVVGQLVKTMVTLPARVATGGRKKKRKKSKSKNFYINRIKRTLKYFYNY